MARGRVSQNAVASCPKAPTLRVLSTEACSKDEENCVMKRGDFQSFSILGMFDICKLDAGQLEYTRYLTNS